jgi:hypothetical protein
MTDDPLNGVWVLNLERSMAPSGEEPAFETMSFAIARGIERFLVDFALPGEPVMKMGYTTRYGDMENWQPYRVLAIEGDDGPPFPAVGWTRRTTVGDAICQVATVRVDERTRYRVSRSNAGEAAHVIQLRVSDDAMRLDVTVFDLAGKVRLVRSLDKR